MVPVVVGALGCVVQAKTQASATRSISDGPVGICLYIDGWELFADQGVVTQ